jgi:plasmid stabilization system protein ParE
MAEIIWTDSALDQLSEIAEHIALDNPAAAGALVEDIFQKVDRLGRFPNSGRHPPELPDSVYREIIREPCRVFYRRDRNRVLILHAMCEERQLRRYLLDRRE